MDGALTVQQKLRRSRYVVTLDTGAGVKQIIALNYFGVRIGKNCKRISGLLAQVERFLGSIYADCNRANTRLMEFVQTPLNTPQLGVAGRSPVTAVEDQQHTFR